MFSTIQAFLSRTFDFAVNLLGQLEYDITYMVNNPGNDKAFLVPRSGLIAEAGVIATYMVGRNGNGARQQRSNINLENHVRFEADVVESISGNLGRG
jgi:hypothetical protein